MLARPQRSKRSVSLAPDLLLAIKRAAREEGMTISGWLARTASHRLRIEAGRRAIAAWEREHGPLTAEELAEGLARARALLGRDRLSRAKRPA